MALGKCPECAGSVSTTAIACPHCGNTTFLVPTRKSVAQKCSWCHGSGTDYMDAWRFSCTRCRGTGQQQWVELKDLRDGSLSSVVC